MANSVPCPCCGAPVTAPVALEALRYVRLAPSEAKIVGLFVAAYPASVRTSAITNELWGLDPTGGPDAAANGIAVRIHRINKKIGSLGWRIQSPDGASGRALTRLTPVAAEQRQAA